jgi:hypothetical protein
MELTTMKIARYWAKTSIEAKLPGKPSFPVCCWGASNVSLGQAKENAKARARNVLNHFGKSDRGFNRYLYSDRMLREEIIREFPDSSRSIAYAVTRNTYGALVLNTSKVLFADIDLEPESAWTGLKRMLGLVRQSQADAVLETIQEWSATRPERGLRIYRTFNGYRLLLTDALFDPTGQESQQLLESLGSDELYLKLCRAQESFRARLSPKPWRINLENPPCRFPYDESEKRMRHHDWVSKYELSSKDYAICRLVLELGNKTVHPEVKPVIQLHDLYCRVDVDKPLA